MIINALLGWRVVGGHNVDMGLEWIFYDSVISWLSQEQNECPENIYIT